MNGNGNVVRLLPLRTLLHGSNITFTMPFVADTHHKWRLAALTSSTPASAFQSLLNYGADHTW